MEDIRLTDTPPARLRLLGEVRLEVRGEELLAGRRKPLLLLAFVACHGPRGVSREAAIEAMWGDRPEARARQSVRQALLLLRRTLGDVLVADRERIALRPGSVRVDALEIDAWLEERLASPDAPGPDETRFLPGAEDEGSPAFRLWLERWRADLTARISARCSAILDEAVVLRRGEEPERADGADGAERAERAARLWSGVSPLEARPVEALLSLLPALGRPGDAWAFWEGWSAAWKAVLDEPPPDAVARLADRVRRMVAERGMPPDLRPHGPGSLALFSPDLVERGHVVERLERALRDCRGGEGRVIALTGADGIGKSRVLNAFLDRGRSPGPVLILVTGPLPPLQESRAGALRALLQPLGSAPGLGGASDASIRMLAGLSSSVCERFPDLGPPGDRELPDPDPRAVGRALAEALEVVAEEIPVVVAVDDVTQLDPLSRTALAELVRVPPRGVLLVVTSDENPVRRPGTLLSAPHVECIELPPLTLQGVQEMIGSMMALHPSLRGPLSAHLHRASEGAPLLVVLLLQAVADAGRIRPGRDGAWRLAEPGDIPDFTDAPGVHAALAPRWATLSDSMRSIVEAIAVAGSPVPADRLRAVSGLDTGAFDGALDALLARRMLREVTLAGETTGLDLSHPLVRKAACASMNPRAREAMQRRLAKLLSAEAREPTGGSRPASPAQVILGAAALVLLLGLGLAWMQRPAAVDPHLVAVFPFDARTDAESAWLGAGVSDLLASGLEGVGPLRTVDAQALAASLSGGSPSRHEASRIARRLGAGAWVHGSVVGSGDRVRIQAGLFRDRGRYLGVDSDPVSPDTLFEEVERLVLELLPHLLRGASVPRIELASTTTRSTRALESFLAGEEAFRAGRYQEALSAYHDALAADSTFALAHLRSALALEWGGEAPPARILESLRAAALVGERLPARERRLLRALLRYHGGEPLEAVEALRELLAEEPEFLDAWFAMAEVLFHALPRAGNPYAIGEAHRVLEQVLRLSPGHEEALLHLPRTAVALGRHDLARSALERLRDAGFADRPIFLTTEIFTAWALADREEMQRLRPRIRAAPPLLPLVSGAFLAVYARDPLLAADVVAGLDAVDRPDVVRGTARLWRAVFLRKAGDLSGSDEALRSAGRLLPAEALRLEALFLADPTRSMPIATAPDPGMRPGTRVQEVLAGLSPPDPGAPRDPGGRGGPSISLPWPGSPRDTGPIDPLVDAYLSGLLLSASGRIDDAREEVGRLEAARDGIDPEVSELAEALWRGLGAELLRREGRADDALEMLRPIRLGGWHQAAFGYPIFALPRERLLMALLLRETGDLEEALRWEASLDGATPFDGIWGPLPRPRPRQ